MFLGEYEHTIDDKNRLTLPARFREAFADGVVLTRGLDECLDVYARGDWGALVDARLATLDPFSKEARDLKRFFFSAASDAELDKQGRVLVPPALMRHGRLGRELLAVQPGETVVDATFGAGGHSRLLADDLRGEGKLIAIDRDPSARTYFDRFKARSSVQARFLRGEFSLVLNQLAGNDVQADAILLDLGVSSMQLDRPERGFSYAADAPLDMRMDTAADLSARELVNEADERELGLIFKRYGEERYARQIARAIVRRRSETPFERTGDLAETIKQAIPTPARFGDGHPARRVFQALRIAVNDELGALEAALPAAVRMLRPGGRIAVISFHSLEDRIVKRYFRELARGCTCPPEFPVCVCGNEPILRDLTRKPLRPGARELEANPRAASAKLRAATKVGA